MKLKTFAICVGIAFVIWLIPFSLRLAINFDQPEAPVKKALVKEPAKGVVTNIFEAYASGDKNEAFHLIFFNNLKVAVINIAGGLFLGLGTFVNLALNGFYAADVFSTIHKNGMSWSKIIEHTAPHSFEMIGIWMSGGLGFYIALLMIGIMVKNKYPTILNYKIIVTSSLCIGLIILLAAYMEAYVSVK
jgi:stage II sporulation protein M